MSPSSRSLRYADHPRALVFTELWQVDFYNNIKSYLSELENTEIRSLEDIVQ